ncbi:hypothetical protein SDC9_83338 [bioreactor metagenome]|uniref:Uncharacterized protein n=1 Tax=bioreactor metagenome TaxID=1076179 RepID=A0A644Z7B8_9ZZZZ
MDDHEFSDDFCYRHPGIDAGIGVLEDDLHFPPHGFHLPAAIFQDVLTIKQNLTVGSIEETYNSTAKGGFAAS